MRFKDADKKFARDTLVSIVRAIAVRRAIQGLKPDVTATFWHVINGGLFDMAVVDWCVLFGSHHEHNQRLHWKNMFEADAFRPALHGALGVTGDEWSEYQKTIKAYRDENAAHRSLDPKTDAYPNMDRALAATYFYWDWLKATVGDEPLSLKDEYERSLETFTELAKVAVAATAETGIAGG